MDGLPFIYVHSDDIFFGRRLGRLVSPVVFGQSPTKLTFWYRAYGPGIDDVDVQIENSMGDSIQVLWTLPTRSPEWTLAEVIFCSPFDYYKVRLLQIFFNFQTLLWSIDRQLNDER